MPIPLLRWLAVLWTLGIVAACTVPPTSIPGPSSLLSFDKAIHALLFAGFGTLWMLALPGAPGRRAGWVLPLGVAFAVGTELYQGLLPWPRLPDPNDALADVAGLLIAVALTYRWIPRAPTPASDA